MAKQKVLHVVSVSFSLSYFIGNQFDYFRDLGKGSDFFVACYPDEYFFEYCSRLKATAVPVNILRQINIVEDIKAIKQLIKTIKENKIDIVIGHSPKGAMVAMIAAYLAGVKRRVYFRHGLMFETSKGAKRILLKSIEQLTGKLAKTVVCVSNSILQRSNEEKLNRPSKNILLNKGTCNGIDAQVQFNKQHLDPNIINALKSQYNIMPDSKVIGYVGRLVKDKGIQELLDAWKIIIQTDAQARLLLVGPIEERDPIGEDYKKFIENEPSIIHTGLIREVPPFYSLMNAFILPSYREGFPTVVLEASSMELPVITTLSTGCRDAIVENETGIFTEINPESIAKKIKFYLDNNDIAIRHGENGRLFVVENFEQHIVWDAIDEKILNS